jgi:ornithine decarboxylase
MVRADANPCKPPSHIQYAKEHNVDLMTFDSVEELKKIKSIFPEARVVLRILADDSSSVCRLGLKFGAAFGSHTTTLLKAVKQLGLNLVGISFHAGSGCTDPNAFDDAIHKARKLFRQAEAMGMHLTLLDIGGGFPGEPVEGVPQAVSFETIAAVVDNAIGVYFADCPDLTCIAEPGRFFASGAMTLALNIIAKRVTNVPTEEELVASAIGSEESDGESDDNMGCLTFQDMVDTVAEPMNNNARVSYFVNDGVYGSFNCLIFDHAHVFLRPLVTAMDFAKDSALFSSTVWGPTCDSMDCVAMECKLPNLAVGEWIYAAGMGAYTGAAASTFNGFAKADFIYTFSADETMDLDVLPYGFPLNVMALKNQQRATTSTL